MNNVDFEEIGRFRQEASNLLLTWQKSSKVWPSKVSHLREISLANQFVDSESLGQYAERGTLTLADFFDPTIDPNRQMKVFCSMNLAEMLVVLESMIPKENA